MGDDESRREDARIEALLERAIRNGTMGECAECGRITGDTFEDPDTGAMSWLCRKCQEEL